MHITQNVFDLIISRYHSESKNEKFIYDFFDISAILLRLNHYQNAQEANYEKTTLINKNVLEIEYSKLEQKISTIIKKINTNTEQYINELKDNPENSLALIVILLFQFYRTKKIRKMLNDTIRELYVKKENKQIKLSDKEKLSFIKIMQYLDPIIESKKLIANGFSIELIKNNTNIKFITSSSPAVITNKYNKSLMGFMPLTPSIFIVINFENSNNNQFNYRIIDNGKYINALNDIIDENSDEIYELVD